MNNATQTIETNSSTGCAIFKVPGLEYVFHSLTHLTYEGNSFVTFELFAEGDKTKLNLPTKDWKHFLPATRIWQKKILRQDGNKLLAPV